jgi:hypothetical protein
MKPITGDSLWHSFTTVEKSSKGRERQRKRDKDGEIQIDHRKLFFFTHDTWKVIKTIEHKKSVRREKAASHLDDATILLHSVCHEAEIRPLMVGKLC